MQKEPSADDGDDADAVVVVCGYGGDEDGVEYLDWEAYELSTAECDNNPYKMFDPFPQVSLQLLDTDCFTVTCMEFIKNHMEHS